MAEKYSSAGQFIPCKTEEIPINGSGSYTFDASAHPVVRASLKVQSISGTLTVTAKDGMEAGSCAHSLANGFSAASSQGEQRKINVCDEFVDYAWVLAAPENRLSEVAAQEGNTSTSTVSVTGAISDSDTEEHNISVKVSSAGDLSASPVEPAEVIVSVDGTDGEAVAVSEANDEIPIGDTGLKFKFTGGTLEKDDVWFVDVCGVEVDAVLLIEAI